VTTKRRREIIEEAAKDELTPIQVILHTMRALWGEAPKGNFPDLGLPEEAAIKPQLTRHYTGE
jgi:hypothetical protein